jgi:hypothetical protein
MAGYRFYFMNADNHTVADHENIDCADDALAKLIAARLLAEQTKHPGIEVWVEERRVSRHFRKS